uniref:Uncharacterized protein n=1 Tax=uncultured marine virus TaxID=186617 RepID=A0A0F7LBC9_9VIRU|nr:hypothetical protein AURANDRAFT_61302 [uncultured marine virus]
MAEYINPQWRLPNKKTGNNSNYSMDFTMGTGVNFGSLSNILGNGIITYNTSYSVWIKPDFSYDTNTYQTFFGNFASGNNVLLLYYAHDINAFKFAVGDGSGHNFVSSQAFTSDQELGKGEWQHHCVSFDTVNNNAYYYIDNVQVNTSTGLSRKIATNQNFYIGKKWDLTSGGFTGEISQGCIFKYALPPTGSNSVAALWNGGNPGNPMALSSPPVAYYPLGNSAHMGANYLTPNGALQDYVFDFASSDSIDTNFTLPNYNSYSISVWYKKDRGTVGALPAGDHYLWGNATSGGANKPRTSVRFNDTNELRIITGDGTVYFQSPDLNVSTLLLDGKWHHILTTTVSGEIKLYIDGGLQATHTNSNIVTGIVAETSYRIGQSGYNAGYLTESLLSNFQLFNTALSGPEVETLYNNGSPIQTLANIPQSSNLKAWYKLDATEIYNSSSTEWSVDNNQNPSAYPSSLDFSGTDQYISCSSSSVFQNTSNFSVSFWVNMDDYSGGGCFLMSANAGSSIFHIYAYGGNTIQVRLRENNLGNGLISNVDLNNKWSNICLVYDGTKTGNSNRLKFYLNKVEQTISFNSDIQSSINISSNFLIGQQSGQSGVYTIDGKLSNVSLFSNSLTDGTGGTLNQIETLYNNGTPLADMSSFSSLVSWWKLNNTTTGIEDSKGSNNGTNNGATEYPGFVNTLAGDSSGMSQSSLVQSDLLTTSSYSPYALSFSGDGSYIDLNSDITLTGNKSVSFWVNFTSTISGVVFGGASAHYYPYIDATNIWIRAGGDYTTFAHGGLTSGVWYNICITGDGTNATAYLNGSSLGTQTDRGFTIKLINGEHTGIYGVNGKLSNCAIWNTVLTSSQVREIYNEGRPSNLHNFSGTAPIAWWQLGSNSSWTSPAWTVLDEIGSNNGTSSSMLENTIVDGVGTSGNGVSTGMGLANNISGSSPSGEANSLSVNMTLANIAGGVN